MDSEVNVTTATFQKEVLESNINSLSVALENVTASLYIETNGNRIVCFRAPIIMKRRNYRIILCIK